jgi:hypothetical protein
LSQLVYELIHCQQFRVLRKKAGKLSSEPLKNQKQIHSLYKHSQRLYQLRHLARKADIVLVSRRMK